MKTEHKIILVIKAKTLPEELLKEEEQSPKQGTTSSYYPAKSSSCMQRLIMGCLQANLSLLKDQATQMKIKLSKCGILQPETVLRSKESPDMVLTHLWKPLPNKSTLQTKANSDLPDTL